MKREKLDLSGMNSSINPKCPFPKTSTPNLNVFYFGLFISSILHLQSVDCPSFMAFANRNELHKSGITFGQWTHPGNHLGIGIVFV